MEKETGGEIPRLAAETHPSESEIRADKFFKIKNNLHDVPPFELIQHETLLRSLYKTSAYLVNRI